MMVQFDVKRVQKGTESFMVSFDFNKTPVTQIADYIIIAASKHNTSDIHFDPRDEGMMVRFRIDGDCQDYTFVPKAYEKNLTTRLKLLANMNITESRLPQDGAIKGIFGDTYLDMRVSALPLNTGEKIVIRILDYTRSLQGIDSLGFHPKNLEKIKRMMGLPNGIILTTGATGSGKSTTTYSILQGLNKPEMNVITVEDPIEMNIEGINQVQVNAEIGMTFAAALRSILRQDPNVILIGEIRDSETAQIAVRASITGHLVLSTIHTNNALATVERLLDMNVERYLLSTALSGVISQRLAKMLCPDCRYQRATTKYEKKVFKKYMKMDVEQVWDANPKGCDNCRRGYHGRIAVHEVLEINDEIRGALSNEKLEKADLAKLVYSHGTITMLQDALIKCLEGKTSFEEIYRTIEIENEDDDNYESEIENEIMESIPVEEVVEVSDDLLETPIEKNDVGSVILPPSFTAEDFQDDKIPEGNTTTESTDTTVATVQVAETTPVVEAQAVATTVPTVETTTVAENTADTTPMTTVPEVHAFEDIIIESPAATVPETSAQVDDVQVTDITPIIDSTLSSVSEALVPTVEVQLTETTPIEITPETSAPLVDTQVTDTTPVLDNVVEATPETSVPLVDTQVADTTPILDNTVVEIPGASYSPIPTITEDQNVVEQQVTPQEEVQEETNTTVLTIPGVTIAPPVEESNVNLTSDYENEIKVENTPTEIFDLNVLPSSQTGAVNIVNTSGFPQTMSMVNPIVSEINVNDNSLYDVQDTSILNISIPSVQPDNESVQPNNNVTDFSNIPKL